MTDANFKNLKVIFIDWYLTLTSTTFLNKLKLENYALFRKFIETIFENNPEGWQYDWARGKLSKEDAAEKIAQAGLMPYDKVLQTFADSCAHQTIDYPETLNIINRLRNEGIKVVLSTDNWDVFCQYTVPSLHLKEYFDDILSSNELGVLKRDVCNQRVPFFENFMQNKNLDRDEVVLIDDAAVNIETCQSRKISAIKTANCADTLSILENIWKQKCKKD